MTNSYCGLSHSERELHRWHSGGCGPFIWNVKFGVSEIFYGNSTMVGLVVLLVEAYLTVDTLFGHRVGEGRHQWAYMNTKDGRAFALLNKIIDREILWLHDGGHRVFNKQD